MTCYDLLSYASFPIVNYPFLDGDVSLSPSYGVYISQLVLLARVCNNVLAFSKKNLCITEKNITPGFSVSQTSQNIY